MTKSIFLFVIAYSKKPFEFFSRTSANKNQGSKYFFVALFRAQAHAMASEQSSRLSSLQNAEKNIKEHREGLQALFRSKRQATITAEMLDLVTGFKTIQRRKAGSGLFSMLKFP